MLDIKIYGCHSRDENIKKCKDVLNLKDSDIIYDDRPKGGNAYYTFKKALTQPLEEGITHRLVLPDDMQLCEGFEEKLNFFVNKFPKKVLELFPFGYEALPFLPKDTPYLRTFAPSACGLVFPVQIINEMISWIESEYLAKTYLTVDTIIDDTAVMDWCGNFSMDMITTAPSLVQHIGDTSLLGDFPVRRTRFFYDDLTEDQKRSINWESDKIREYHPILNRYSRMHRTPFKDEDGNICYPFDLQEMKVRHLNAKQSSLGNTID